jgi:hypothetical protein
MECARQRKPAAAGDRRRRFHCRRHAGQRFLETASAARLPLAEPPSPPAEVSVAVSTAGFAATWKPPPRGVAAAYEIRVANSAMPTPGEAVLVVTVPPPPVCWPPDRAGTVFVSVVAIGPDQQRSAASVPAPAQYPLAKLDVPVPVGPASGQTVADAPVPQVTWQAAPRTTAARAGVTTALSMPAPGRKVRALVDGIVTPARLVAGTVQLDIPAGRHAVTVMRE